MEWEAIQKRLNDLLEKGRHGELRGAMMMLNEVDIAQYMETLDKEKLLLVFRILPKDISADVFSYMSAEQKQTLIESIGDQEIRALMQCFDHPDYVASCGFDCHPESSEEMMECMCRFLPGDFAGNIKNMQQMLKMMQVMQAMNDSGSQGPPPNNNCGNPCDFPPQPGCGAPPPPPDYAPRQDIGRNPDHNCNNRSGRHKDLYSSVMDILNSQ